MFLQIDEDQIRNDQTTDIFRGSLIFYHYKCDGKNDVGWGCAYRTIQTLSSWIIKTKKDYSTQIVPTIDRIQEILVDLEDKPKSFQQSNQWIGTYEASIVLSQLFDVNIFTSMSIFSLSVRIDLQVDCKLIHIANGSDLRQHVETLKKHFHEFGSPVMMGGDADAASKCLLGVKSDREFLILVKYPIFSHRITFVFRSGSALFWFHIDICRSFTSIRLFTLVSCAR